MAIRRTYVVAVLAAAVTGLKFAGLITEEVFQLLMGLLASGGIASVRAAINRVEQRVR